MYHKIHSSMLILMCTGFMGCDTRTSKAVRTHACDINNNQYQLQLQMLKQQLKQDAIRIYQHAGIEGLAQRTWTEYAHKIEIQLFLETAQKAQRHQPTLHACMLNVSVAIPIELLPSDRIDLSFIQQRTSNIHPKQVWRVQWNPLTHRFLYSAQFKLSAENEALNVSQLKQSSSALWHTILKKNNHKAAQAVATSNAISIDEQKKA